MSVDAGLTLQLTLNWKFPTKPTMVENAKMVMIWIKNKTSNTRISGLNSVGILAKRKEELKSDYDLTWHWEHLLHFKDVRAHCYCASLVHTLYMTWRVPRHVFQARAPSQNSKKYRAEDFCGNLICEYFCWMLDEPPLFFRQITFFSDSFHNTKKQKKSVRGKF